jgi:hypothetical protein
VVARPDDCCFSYNPRRTERHFGRQPTGAQDKAHLQPDAVRILDKHVVIARRSVAFCGPRMMVTAVSLSAINLAADISARRRKRASASSE